MMKSRDVLCDDNDRGGMDAEETTKREARVLNWFVREEIGKREVMTAKTFDLFWEEKVSGGGGGLLGTSLCGSSRWTVTYSQQQYEVTRRSKTCRETPSYVPGTYPRTPTMLISIAGFVAQRSRSCLMQPVLDGVPDLD